MTQAPSGKLGSGSIWGSTCILTASVIAPVLNPEHPSLPIIPLESAPLPPQTLPTPAHLSENPQEETEVVYTQELIPSTNTRKPAVEPDTTLLEKLGHEEGSQRDVPN